MRPQAPPLLPQPPVNTGLTSRGTLLLAKMSYFGTLPCLDLEATLRLVGGLWVACWWLPCGSCPQCPHSGHSLAVVPPSTSSRAAIAPTNARPLCFSFQPRADRVAALKSAAGTRPVGRVPVNSCPGGALTARARGARSTRRGRRGRHPATSSLRSRRRARGRNCRTLSDGRGR